MPKQYVPSKGDLNETRKFEFNGEEYTFDKSTGIYFTKEGRALYNMKGARKI